MINLLQYFCGRSSPHWDMASSFTRFLDHTQRRTIIGKTSLDDGSARRRDFYLTTHNISTDKHRCPGGFRTHNLSRRAAADLSLRPREHWDRQFVAVQIVFMVVSCSGLLYTRQLKFGYIKTE